jgi:hypothetical protein
MQRDFAGHPEIAAQTITAPIFLCGMGRTGSTKAHRLLAASGDFNFARYWTVFNPALRGGDPAESPAPRIAEAQAYVAWFDAASPELKYGHAFEPHETEEESLILEQSLRSPVALGWAPIGSYLGWLATQDMAAQFEYLRDVLKYLQWQGLGRADRRWVLKSPLYTGLERNLLQVFPDACLVMTHREPVSVMASGLRLMDLFHQPFTALAPDYAGCLAGMAGAAAQHLANRTALPAMKSLDVDFRQLTGDVAPVLRQIYRFIGLTLRPDVLQAMLDWNRAHPPHRHGKFVYDLADYHFTSAQVEEMFADYIMFLERAFPAAG